jgi:hypothetical protein
VTDSAYTKTVSAFPDDKIASNRRIVLLTTDTFIVYSSFDIIIDNLKKFIAEYDVEEDKNLLNKFLNTSKSLEGNLQDIRKDEKLKSRLDFRTADLLECAMCVVYNKVSKSCEKQITMTTYIKNWWNGKRFSSLNNQIIMDIRTGAY